MWTRLFYSIVSLLLVLFYTLMSLPGFKLVDKWLYSVKNVDPDRESRLKRILALVPPELGFRHSFLRGQGDVQLHAAHIGDENGPLMLFVHGFPESWYSWRHQMIHFSRLGFYCVAIEMRGYGASDKPPRRVDYRQDLIVEDIRRVILELSPKRPILLVAHDWGAAIGWAITHRYPELFTRYICLNLPHPSIFLKHFQTSEQQMRRSWYIFYFQLPWVAEKRLLESGKGYIDQEDLNKQMEERSAPAFVDVDNSTAIRPSAGIALERVYFESLEHPDRTSLKEVRSIASSIQEPGTITAIINYYRNLFSLSAMLKQRKQAKSGGKNKVPTLLIWGEKDNALGKELTFGTDRYVETLEVKYIPDSSHWVQQDTPETVNEIMGTYLKSLLPESAELSHLST